MDFDFSPEQNLIRDQAHQFMTNEVTPAFVRRMMEDEQGYSQEMWRQMGGLGLLGLSIPEAYGGMGLGLVEDALLLEEMGRAVFPGPFFASVILAAQAILAGGTEEQKRQYLPSIASGELKGTLALLEESLAWGADAVHSQAAQGEGDYLLNGVKRFVPFAGAADFMLIPTRIGESAGTVSLFIVDAHSPGLTHKPQTSIDLATRQCEIHLENVWVPQACLLGGPGNGAAILDTVLDRAAVAACAEMLGATRQCLDMSVQYAKVRQQFGQPIGMFQAIKHKLADMLLEVESAHSATYYAAWALDAHSPDARVAVSAAKSYVSEAARKVCGEAIQVHGGIGFTWEYDLHLPFKRAKYLEPLYGDAEWHRERLAAGLGQNTAL